MASDRLPSPSMRPSFTASSPSSTLPTSVASSSVFMHSSVNRLGDIWELDVTKVVIRSCIR